MRVLLGFLVLLMTAGCEVKCNDGTTHERNNKGSVVCRNHGGEKVTVEG